MQVSLQVISVSKILSPINHITWINMAAYIIQTASQCRACFMGVNVWCQYAVVRGPASAAASPCASPPLVSAAMALPAPVMRSFSSPAELILLLLLNPLLRNKSIRLPCHCKLVVGRGLFTARLVSWADWPSRKTQGRHCVCVWRARADVSTQCTHCTVQWVWHNKSLLHCNFLILEQQADLDY